MSSANAQPVQRPTEGRVIAGVCLALAERFNLEVWLLRLAFALLAFASGIGVLIYAGLWLTTPSTNTDAAPWRIVLEAVRGNTQPLRSSAEAARTSFEEAWQRTDETPEPRPLSRRWLALGLVAAGAALFLHGVGLFSWLGFWGALGVVGICIGSGMLVSLRKSRSTELEL